MILRERMKNYWWKTALIVTLGLNKESKKLISIRNKWYRHGIFRWIT